MNKENVIQAAIKMSAAGFNHRQAVTKIEQGFLDGDVIPMSAERYIKIEDGKAVGYNGHIAENSFVLDDLPETQIEQLMAAYIVKNFPADMQKVY